MCKTRCIVQNASLVSLFSACGIVCLFGGVGSVTRRKGEKMNRRNCWSMLFSCLRCQRVRPSVEPFSRNCSGCRPLLLHGNRCECNANNTCVVIVRMPLSCNCYVHVKHAWLSAVTRTVFTPDVTSCSILSLTHVCPIAGEACRNCQVEHFNVIALKSLFQRNSAIMFRQYAHGPIMLSRSTLESEAEASF